MRTLPTRPRPASPLRRLAASVRVPAAATLLPTFFVALAVACSPPGEGGDDGPAEGGVKRREVPLVRVAAVERRPMVRLLETTSKLESEREIQLLPRAGGVVVEVLAEEGDRVTEGTVLARLDDRDQVLAVSDAKVALEEARQAVALARLAVEEAEARREAAVLSAAQATRDYERDLALFEGRGQEGPNPVSALSRAALEATRLAKDSADSDVAQQEIAVRRAEADVVARENAVARAEVTLERAEVSLAYTELLAPIDGIVAERTVRVGAMASTAEAAFVLTDPDHLRAVFRRPQEEYALFRGATSTGGSSPARLVFEATSEAWPGKTFRGWVERVSPTLDPESSQFRVTANFEATAAEGNAVLLPGMLVRLAIETDRHRDALVVPKRALRREGDRRFVLRVADGTLERVDVLEELDFATEDHVEVRPEEGQALAAGDEIVVVGSRDLVDGDPVRVDVPGAAPEEEDEGAASELASTDEPEPDAATEGDVTDDDTPATDTDDE